MFISIDHITIQAGSQTWFEHTTWHISPGQNWAMVGPNGAGKTGLMLALCRKLPLAEGQVRYYFDPANEPQGRSYLKAGEIQILSAETHRAFLRPYAEYHQARYQSFEGEDAPSVAELLGPGPAGTNPGLEDSGARWAEIVRWLKLEPLLERKILHLSHGESRKVLIARLWLQAPRLLVLDDPYTGLDVASRGVLAQAIEALIAQGSPQLLFIASRIEEVPAGIPNLLVVQDRRVVAQGPRAEVLARMELMQGGGPGRPGAPAFQANPAFERMAEGYANQLAQNPLLDSSELVRMHEVSVRYGEVQVLDHLSWRVRRGERWALLGHNGAGKTTLLSLILGDHPQSYANSIELFGRPRGSGESIWEIKRNIGWVSPELHIYYPRTASTLDVVCSGFFDSSGLYRRPGPEQTGLANGWLEAFGLLERAGDAFHNLSSGQQRLALLARALVKAPPLLILDEPCQGLDETHRRHFLDLLGQLCRRAPLTLIFVTHNSEEIPAWFTHRMVLDRGRPVG